MRYIRRYNENKEIEGNTNPQDIKDGKNLIKLNGEYYLIDADFNRMSKDLPEGTVCFCVHEIHMNDSKECIRKSTKGDHCHGCQPLLASTEKVDGVDHLSEEEIKNMI